MDILAGLRQLLGIKEQPKKKEFQRNAQAEPTVGPGQVRFEDGSVGSPYPKVWEDDRLVSTNRGPMPLSAVEGDIQRVPDPYTNKFGSTVVPWRGTTIPTQSRGITGATNINEQVYRGNTPYSPGEGPRTIFDELLRRR